VKVKISLKLLRHRFPFWRLGSDGDRDLTPAATANRQDDRGGNSEAYESHHSFHAISPNWNTGAIHRHISYRIAYLDAREILIFHDFDEQALKDACLPQLCAGRSANTENRGFSWASMCYYLIAAIEQVDRLAGVPRGTLEVDGVCRCLYAMHQRNLALGDEFHCMTAVIIHPPS
jgi:hypothetical protein